MPAPEAITDQNSAGSVPGADDQSTSTPDGKTVINSSQATALKGATGGILPDHYVVKDDEPAPEAPAAPAAPADELEGQDPVPEPEGDPDFDVAPAAGTEDETGTSFEPENDSSPAPEPEGEPTFDEDGFTYGKLGALDYRQDKDGNVFFQENIDGEIAWIKSGAYKAGYQLKQHVNREAQKLAEDKKAFQKKRDFDSILNNISSTNPEPSNQGEGDDLWEPDKTAQGNDEVSKLKKEVDDLKAQNEADKKAKDEAQQIAALDREINLARGQMEAFLDLQGVKAKPTDKQLIAMIKEYSENEDIPPEKVAVSPASLIEMVQSKLKIKKAPKKPSADATPKPPTASSPRKTTPVPSQRLAEVDQKLADLGKKAKKEGANNPRITSELIALNRERNKLLKGG